MHSWDVVCAISCKELNKKLQGYIRDFFSTFNWSDGNGNSISGEFEYWEIVPGGDSQRLNIITPIITGNMKASILGKEINFDVDGICPKIQVELTFVKKLGNDSTHLKFNFVRMVTRENRLPWGEGGVVILDSDINNTFTGENSIFVEIFCELMTMMFIAQKSNIEFIFAEILTIPKESKNSYFELKSFQYAYNEKLKGGLGTLAVLGILKSNKSPPGAENLQLIFDSSLIRDDGKIGFMMSKNVFMEHIVLPGLIEVFKGSKINQFRLLNDGKIKNNGNVSLDKINGYIPYFNSVNIFILDDKLIINNSWGRCDVVSYSSYVTFDLAASYTPRLSLENGLSTVNFDCSAGPFFNSEAHDTLALVFWIFGGWVVDALIQGIRGQMKYLLFKFGSEGIKFDIYPVKFNSEFEYSECGLAGNFYMRD